LSSFYDSSNVANTLSKLTVLEIVQALPEVNWVARVVGTRLKVMKVVSSLPNELQDRIQNIGRSKLIQYEEELTHVWEDREHSKKRRWDEDEAYHESKRQKLWNSIEDGSTYLNPIDLNIQLDRLTKFIDKSSNKYIQQAVCCVCARRMEKVRTRYSTVKEIPHQVMLKPGKTNGQHHLTKGLLLHESAMVYNDEETHGQVCYECWDSLSKAVLPRLSLANNLWIGPVPFELSVLTLPEQVLISRFYPASYIIKLYPKTRGGSSWDEKQLNCRLHGNVSTYRLDPSQVAHMASGLLLPSRPNILAAIISVTLVGPQNVKEKTLKGVLQVRRQRVLEALSWLKGHNPIYAAVEIDMEAINQLPVEGIPDSMMDNVKVDTTVCHLEEEQSGYIPDCSIDDENGKEDAGKALPNEFIQKLTDRHGRE
jgi:Domain of unknown function (DUF6570)